MNDTLPDYWYLRPMSQRFRALDGAARFLLFAWPTRPDDILTDRAAPGEADP